MSALHDAARRVVSAWVSTRPAWIEQCNAAVLALDAALKAEPAQEPVAWMYKGERWFDGDRWRDDHRATTDEKLAKWKDKNARPLYTAPQPQRPLLTDEEIWACLPAEEDEVAFARAVERKVRGE